MSDDLIPVLVEAVEESGDPPGVRVYFRSASGVQLYTIVKESDDADWIRRLAGAGRPLRIGLPPNVSVWRVSDENRKDRRSP